MIRMLKLWVWQWRVGGLEAQIEHGEALLRETRARLQQSYRQLRQARVRVAELTPARRLLKQMMARRRSGVASR